VEALYHLAEILKKENPAQSEKEYKELLEKIVAARPRNLFIQSVLMRQALAKNDRATLQEGMARFEKLASGWSEQTRSAFDAAKASLDKRDDSDMEGFLNVLMAEEDFRIGSAETNNTTEVGSPMRNFIRVAPVRNAPSPPDTGITFTQE